MTQKKSNHPKKINQELSIQISLNGLSFCILQKRKKNISIFKDFNFEKKLNPFEVLDFLKQLFNTEEALNQPFNAVNIIHTNELSTLVAGELFNEDNLADYLKFNAKILKSDFIAFDNITNNNLVNVYVPYVNINNFIYDTFGAFTYKHFSTVLIENILKLEENLSNVTNVYAHIGIGHFEIVAVDKGKLLLYNTFEYKTKEDFIYYILFTFEQLHLNPESHNLILLGDISKESDLYSLAYKYIRHVNFGETKNNYQFKGKTSHKHSNFIIFNSF